ncbi:arginine--tRNA ligase [candidate division KSB1 bacterium]
MIHEVLQRVITEAVARLSGADGITLPAVTLEPPAGAGHGDLSTKAAFPLAKMLKRSPREMAETLAAELAVDRSLVQSVEVAGPGFINLVLAPEALRDELRTVLDQADNYGRLDIGQGQRALVEFVSANPTGPLTVGHGRQAAIGDTVANILLWAGYDVAREYYFNNAGRQMRILGESVRLRLRQEMGDEVDFPEDHYQGEYITEIARAIHSHMGDRALDEEGDFFKGKAEEAIFADIRGTLERLGIHFDGYFNEDSLYSGKQIDAVLESLRGKGLAYDADGAVWLKATELNRPKDRVLVKSTGEPTYILPDMAYHQEKFRREFDLIVDVFGADHQDTYPDMLAGVEALGWDLEKVRVLIHQFVTLSEGGQRIKMSTRKANFVTLDELIEEVGADVVRFFFLMRKMSSHLDFDLTTARDTSEKNPVYYVQYAHARIASILRFAAEAGTVVGDYSSAPLDQLATDQELALIKKLIEFPRLVAVMAATLSPHHLTGYLRELATSFHDFYHSGKLDGSRRVVTDDPDSTRARLALVTAAKTVLGNGLRILGVNAPDTM